MEKQRVDWLDILKFLGIFAIYLGHFAEAAGYAFPFVFRFHLPLFFFCAGCAEALGREQSVLTVLKKSAVALLVPFFAFSALSILVYALENNCDLIAVCHQFYYVALGAVRSHFVAYTLWFLTCLFGMRVLFALLRKLKCNWAILLVCAALYAVTSWVFPQTPDDAPLWPWNVDSALYFLLYYALGFVLFPHLQRFLSADGHRTRTLRAVAAAAALLYTFASLFGFDPIERLLGAGAVRPVGLFLCACALIGGQIVLACLLRRVPLFCRVGGATLYLCGNEYIVRTLAAALFSLLGWTVTAATPLESVLYTLALLAAAYFVLTPLERYIVEPLQRAAGRLLRL